MATRALIGFINDKPELISTYNHYDGYPENLGVGLGKFYEEPNEALKIASTGYISYLDPETGEIEAKHKEPADKTPLSSDFEEAMFQVAEKADTYGADYVYIYDVEQLAWVNVKMYGIAQTAEALMGKLKELEGGIFNPAGDVNEAKDVKGHVMMLLDKLESKLGKYEKDNFTAYQESVMRDIKAGGPRLGQYEEFSVDDMEEDFKNYIADKMDIDETLVHQWKFRAGIIK